MLPLVNPFTVSGDAIPVVVPGAPPSEETHVAVKPSSDEPPSEGGTNETAMFPSPAATVGCAGASGTAFSTTTGAEAAEAAPAPLMFDAKTVHVYNLPPVKPVTRSGDDAPGVVPGAPPLDDVHVTVYPVIGDPPSDVGGVNETVILTEPATIEGGAGALGTAIKVTGADATDAEPSPFTFDANTVHVYVLPGVKPATVTGEETSVPKPAVPPSEDVHAAV